MLKILAAKCHACLKCNKKLKNLVLFSCKITHSIINYLDRRGEDLEVLYEKCDWPAEFLRDPSCWLEAEKMEAFLRQLIHEYGASYQMDDGLMEVVGHQCKDLRAWGVLDSVLRMVQTPKDLFAQPERFLSYFVSPAPPLGEIRRDVDSVSFVLPISEELFPSVTTYLRSALEALPTYINKPMATVKWDSSRVYISWSEQQASLFGEAQEQDMSLHPDLVQNILVNLETTQKKLEEMNRELMEKDREIMELKAKLNDNLARPTTVNDGASAIEVKNSIGLGSEFQQLIGGLETEISRPLLATLNNLYRVGDYMARGQQLVTLLIGQGRNTPQVQEAMRRVDWNIVLTEGPSLVKRTIHELQELKNSVQDLNLLTSIEAQEEDPLNTVRVVTDLNEVVRRAVDRVIEQSGTKVQIDQRLLLDRNLLLNPSRLEQVLVSVLKNAVEAAPQGVVRVVTRPKGSRAEIEISDTGRGMDPATLARASEPFFTTKTNAQKRPAAGLGLSLAHAIIKRHEGTLSVSSELGHGSTVRIDLPMNVPSTN